eukprot:9488500-Pyramimonas_sp.AAC.2
MDEGHDLRGAGASIPPPPPDTALRRRRIHNPCTTAIADRTRRLWGCRAGRGKVAAVAGGSR